jgi:hypothetical protein
MTNSIHEIVGRCRGPRLQDGRELNCDECEYYDSEAEAYACCVCKVTIERDKKKA